MRVDVIRFGATFCCQRPDCRPIVDETIAECHRRGFRTRGAALSFVTRTLREAGLTVATPVSLRARRRTIAPGRHDGSAA